MAKILHKPTTIRAPFQAAACILFTPFFTAVFIVERLVLLTIYVVNMEILQYLGLKSAVYNQEGFQIKSGL